MNSPSDKCALREILGARTPEELFSVLGDLTLLTSRETSRAKGCYGCGRCTLPITVEYPDVRIDNLDISDHVSTTGIGLAANPEKRCDDPHGPAVIQAIGEKFQPTDAIQHQH